MDIIHISFAGPYWKIKSPSGKWSWHFEMHNFCGPMRLKWDAKSRNYVPDDRNPTWKENNLFWKCFQAWIDQGQQMEEVDNFGIRLCEYSLEP